MKVITKTVEQILEEEAKTGVGSACPFNLAVIPNYMGINLCSVDSVSWQRQEDGQLTNLTIYFTPSGNDK